MCLEKIEGLFPIVLITPFLSHPCEARDRTQAIVWSSPTCFHRCEANTSWRELLRAGLPQVTLCDGGHLKRQCFGRERHKSLKQSSLPGRVTLIHPAKDKKHDGSSVWGYLHFISEVTMDRGVGEDTVFPGNLTHWHLLSWARCLMAKAAAISYNSEAKLYFPICEHLGCTLRLLADSPSFPAVSPQSAPLPLSANALQTPRIRAVRQLHGLGGKSRQLGAGAGGMEGGSVCWEPGCSPSGEGWVLGIYAAVREK